VLADGGEPYEFAVQALVAIHLDNETAVPTLIAALRKEALAERLVALEVLRRMGNKAVPALPAVSSLLDDPDELIRSSAIAAKKAIRQQSVGR
jgi:HEAT repeat protein